MTRQPIFGGVVAPFGTDTVIFATPIVHAVVECLVLETKVSFVVFTRVFGRLAEFGNAVGRVMRPSSAIATRTLVTFFP